MELVEASVTRVPLFLTESARKDFEVVSERVSVNVWAGHRLPKIKKLAVCDLSLFPIPP